MKPQTVNDLSIDVALIQTARDIAKLDASCIDEKNLPASLYDAVSQASENFPNEIAIKYILDGDCLSQDQIPFSKKVIHHIFRVFKNSNVANPYREITYRNLAEQVTQLANGLRSLGIQKRDVTSLVMPNFPEAYISLWGAATAGVVSPINPLLDSSIIREIMLASKTKVIIALGPVPGSDIWEKVLEIKDHIPNLRAVISVFGPSIPVGKTTKFRSLA
ncbi:AMP-binding protein [Psychrosphaera haliotis]|uniref:AMP-binding protein n=1 Tax=Psychrosphaera haliotis TaxID=555083 RepID=A0A6N8FDD4_9GAMM|nr:AMP-binding protein [Psychrosphaera haliotis]MUH72960.1 AMP-binding protein [Psychrosphaera haliotis]